MYDHIPDHLPSRPDLEWEKRRAFFWIKSMMDWFWGMDASEEAVFSRALRISDCIALVRVIRSAKAMRAAVSVIADLSLAYTVVGLTK
jgi:hypothetical protein